MRSLIAAACLCLLALPVAAERAITDSLDYDAARWADWEAQARMADGDYEGAVQANQEARANWAKADRDRQASSPARAPR